MRMNAQDAVTQYATASNGTRFAYRMIGIHGSSEVPLVCHNHFRGNMDWWDPLLINTIASKREVILFDAPGVGKTRGKVAETFEGWAEDTIVFIQTLRLKKVDLLGFSMGGRAVQMVALTAPQLVRKLVLAGSSPITLTPDSPKPTSDPKYVIGMASATTYEESKDGFRLALFGESETGRFHFNEYWKRLEQRSAEKPLLEPLAMELGGKVQISAVLSADKAEDTTWPDRLAELKMPVLVANGNMDLVLSTARSVQLFERLPSAQLVIYPRSGHGFLWQYASLFGQEVNVFLDSKALHGET